MYLNILDITSGFKLNASRALRVAAGHPEVSQPFEHLDNRFLNISLQGLGLAAKDKQRTTRPDFRKN